MARTQRATSRPQTWSTRTTWRKCGKYGLAGESRIALQRSLQSPGTEIRGKNSFSFGFANAGRISKVIAGLKRTSALGTDGIPVAVLKMGTDVLAVPISHLVNMSLSAGVFPSAYKTALIHPLSTRGEEKQGTTRRCTGPWPS
jgi:hypothetical protein